VVDELLVTRNSLGRSVRKKMKAIPGGIIAVVNHVSLCRTENDALAGIIMDLLNSKLFSDFGPYTLIVFERSNRLQFWSVLFRRVEPAIEQKSILIPGRACASVVKRTII
jgi:hypothetical protein